MAKLWFLTIKEKMMANDIDMWKAIEDLEDAKEAGDLLDCYAARFIDDDDNNECSELYKKLFIKKYGYWGNWY